MIDIVYMINFIIVLLILLYSFTVLFLMADIIKINYRFGVFAYRFLAMGGLLQTLVLVGKTIRQGYFPILTLFEILFFYSLLLIILSILIHHLFKKWKILEMVMVFLGLLTLLCAISTGETFPIISEDFLSKLSFGHILLSVISYAAFSISAIISILFIMYDCSLKKKVWNKFTKNFPSLEGLERNAYYANIVGEILLFIGLIIGLVWASFFYDWKLLFDPKVLFSLIVLYMYGVAIVKRQRKTWVTKELAVWNIVAFFMVLLNFTVTYLLDSFHNWL